MIIEERVEIKTEIENPSDDASGGWSLVIRRIEFILNWINQLCIGFITFYMAWLCIRNKLDGTSLHAFLVTIGFVLMMSEGIMSLYGNNILTIGCNRQIKTTIHWILQAVGGGCGVAGVIVQIVRMKFPLYTIHEKLGFSAFIFCLVTMLSGLSALFSGTLRRIVRPLLNKTVHNFLGLITFILAMVTQFYGYTYLNFLSRSVTNDFQILLQVVTLIIMVLTCIGPLKALYNKLWNILDI